MTCDTLIHVPSRLEALGGRMPLWQHQWRANTGVTHSISTVNVASRVVPIAVTGGTTANPASPILPVMLERRRPMTSVILLEL